MARSIGSRSLPSLRELARAATALRPEDNFSQRLYELLRRTLQRARRAEPQPFYSAREVATAFRLHHSTVADVYARLESEGLLVRVRGSGTLVPARRPVSTHQVIVMPVWLPGFRWILEWRVFLMTLADELSRHGAVADFLFYRQGEEVQPAFIRRVKAHRPDRLFWLEPHPEVDRQPLLRFLDAGLMPVTVTDRPVRMPGFGYWKERQRALVEGLRAWQTDGIERVLVVGDGRRIQDGHLSAAVKATGIGLKLIEMRPNALAKFLPSLVRPGCGVVWDDPLAHLGCALRAPQEMMELYRRTRVLLTRSRLLWTDTPPDVRVDVLHFDAAAAAQRVAEDLVSGQILRTATRPVFDLQWRPRVTAAEVISDGEGL